MDGTISKDQVTSKMKSNTNEELERKTANSSLLKKRSQLRKKSRKKSKRLSRGFKKSIVQYEYQIKSRLTWEYVDGFPDLPNLHKSLINEDTDSQPAKTQLHLTTEKTVDDLPISKSFLENHALKIRETSAAPWWSTNPFNSSVMKYSSETTYRQSDNFQQNLYPENSPRADAESFAFISADKCSKETTVRTKSSAQVSDINIVLGTSRAAETHPIPQRFHKNTFIFDQHSVDGTPPLEIPIVNSVLYQQSYEIVGHEVYCHIGANNSSNDPNEDICVNKKANTNSIYDMNFIQGSDLKHLEETKKRPYKCSCCQKEFSQKGNLVRHQHIHSGEKPFKCTHCPKEFSNRSAMKRHFRFHSGEKPFRCTNCPKEFSDHSNLKLHLHYHSGDKPYKCTECPHTCLSNSDLKKHQRVHSGEKPYKCTECPKMFSTSSHLAVHRRIHTGEKPYKCTLCPRMFRKGGDLKRHHHSHSGEKPYKCTECPKMFSSSNYLKVHQGKHSGDRPY